MKRKLSEINIYNICLWNYVKCLLKKLRSTFWNLTSLNLFQRYLFLHFVCLMELLRISDFFSLSFVTWILICDDAIKCFLIAIIQKTRKSWFISYFYKFTIIVAKTLPFNAHDNHGRYKLQDTASIVWTSSVRWTYSIVHLAYLYNIKARTLYLISNTIMYFRILLYSSTIIVSFIPST